MLQLFFFLNHFVLPRIQFIMQSFFVSLQHNPSDTGFSRVLQQELHDSVPRRTLLLLAMSPAIAGTMVDATTTEPEGAWIMEHFWRRPWVRVRRKFFMHCARPISAAAANFFPTEKYSCTLHLCTHISQMPFLKQPGVLPHHQLCESCEMMVLDAGSITLIPLSI